MKITIPAPKFDLYELVTLHWNDEQRKTRVVARWYNLDAGEWSYEVAGMTKAFYPASALEARD